MPDENRRKLYCCVCGRQLAKDQWDKELLAPLPATHMGMGQFACADCSRLLDENGLFPGEGDAEYYRQMERRHRIQWEP